MKAVGVRELKNRLSEYLREVKQGERILVTDRGEVVAELRSADAAALQDLVEPGLAELARKGLLFIGRRNEPGIYPELPRILTPGRLSELLEEERESR